MLERWTIAAEANERNGSIGALMKKEEVLSQFILARKKNRDDKILILEFSLFSIQWFCLLPSFTKTSRLISF